MKVSLTDAGKRFNRDWIFRHLNYTFQTGSSYAITGPNGSGKSTLLQVLSGSMALSEGNGRWSLGNGTLRHDKIHEQVALCAPYLEVIEEMTLREFLNFHRQFKPFSPGLAIDHIVSIIGLSAAIDKQIRYYSSGMKQRVKLAQAFFSDTPLLLLDEPCTNFDAAGFELYNKLLAEFARDRLLIVSSNDEMEYGFCRERILITEFKNEA